MEKIKREKTEEKQTIHAPYPVALPRYCRSNMVGF